MVAMRLVLVGFGVSTLLAMAAILLTRAGCTRAIAPVQAALLCAASLVYVGSGYDAAPDRAGQAGAGSVAANRCNKDSLTLGPAASALPKPGRGAAQHLPFRIDGLPTAVGPVLRTPHQSGYVRSAVSLYAGNAMTDTDSSHYVDESDEFLHVEIGTPRLGVCAERLTHKVLGGEDGFFTQRIRLMTPGPQLARYHVVLACGVLPGGMALGACAWASTSKAPQPVFGTVWILGNFYRDNQVHRPVSETQLVTLVDMVFAHAIAT
jgi:hypothetical protein